MLYQISERLPAPYTREQLQQLEQAEALFQFDHFTSRDALRLGAQIAREAEALGGDLAILIRRTEDQLPLFQYIGEDRTLRNLEFAKRKGNVTALTGHCSLWGLVEASVTQTDRYGLEQREDCIPAGGAFPIYVGEKLTAIVMTSGLHNGLDHQAIVNAGSVLRGMTAPEFDGTLI